MLKAQETIKGVVKETPVLESKTLSEMTEQTFFINVKTYKKQVLLKQEGLLIL